MADQEHPETTEAEEAAAPEEAAPEGAAEEAAPEAAADEAAPEAAAEEAAPEAAAEEAAPAPTPAPAAPKPEPVAQLSPKERKVASRARRGNRRGATPEERAELRRAKAAARTRRRAAEREKRAGAKGEGTPPAEHGPGAPKVRLGKVTSDKADKTITVRIDVARRHRRYQKIVRSSTTLHAHDEANAAGIGDLVRVVECRPMSATKRWRLVEILERAK
jgi:small subunit ribosomal protein S17